MADEHVQTYWNGEETLAVRGTAVVTDTGQFPHYWAAQEGIVGERIPVVLVVYNGQVSFLDDRTGWGWHKVTEGHGSPAVGHKDVLIKRNSFRQSRPYPALDESLNAAVR